MRPIGFTRSLCFLILFGSCLYSEDVLKVHGNTRIDSDLTPKGSFQFQVPADLPSFQGTAPTWWIERGVMNPDKPAKDSAGVTQGQLKSIAKKAIEEMNAKLTVGAGTKLNALLPLWNTPKLGRNDYSAVNIGQIKAVAKLFYNRLNGVGSNIAYPWTITTSDDADYCAANLGQLKKAFSFSIPNGGGLLQDIDEDGLPDTWEMEKFGNLNQNELDDFDQDGVSNQMEYWTGSDPNDPYNDVVPVLTRMDGNLQKNDAGFVLDRPLKVRVTRPDGTPLVNVPVKFTVVGNYSALTLSRSLAAAAAAQITLRTNSDGMVQSYFRLPEGTENPTVEVTSLARTPGNTITFNETSLTFIGAVASGSYHCLALRQNGTLYSWGHNTNGQLGNTNYEIQYTPVTVPLSNIRQIAAGQYHSVALQNDGTVYTFGANWSSQIGSGQEQVNQSTPLQVLTGVKSIAAGDGYTLALKQDGTVWYWGTITMYDAATQRNIEIKSTTPTKVAGLSDIISIAAGSNHILALQSDGVVWSWGQNTYGQLGNRNTTHQTVPFPIATISGATQVFAGGNQSFARLDDGRLMAWGDNTFGQIPTITESILSTPTELVGFSENYKVVSGYGNSFFLQADQLIQSVGYDFSGQLGRRTKIQQQILGSIEGSNPTRQVATLGSTVLSLMEDGTIWVWGDATYGQSTKEALKQVSYPYLISLKTKENVILVDTDGDELPDRQEVFAGTDTLNPDTDGDGLSDGAELVQGCDPLKQDTDEDGLLDGQEVNIYHTNPALEDTDGDFLADKFEVDYNFNPLVANDPNVDSDGDGMSDWYEYSCGLNPRLNDAGLDKDGDGLTNLQEFQNYSRADLKDSDHDGLDDNVELALGTRLDYWDTDGDRLSDGYEVANGLNPLVANDTTTDEDGDGLTLEEEQGAGTNPRLADSDGDGAGDKVEIQQHSNPTNSNDGGSPPPPSDMLTASFFVSTTGKSVNPSCATCHQMNYTVNGATYGSGSPVTLIKGNTYTLAPKDTPDDTSRGGGGGSPPSVDSATYTFQPTGTKIGTSGGDDVYDAGTWFYLIQGGNTLFKNDVKWNDSYLSQTATIKVPKLTFVTPAGDPVGSPSDNGDGQNEFTYSSESTGVLTVQLKATLSDISILPEDLKNKFKFEVDDIAGSQLEWDSNNSGGKPTVLGNNLTATVRFRGMPSSNSAFGVKKAKILYNGQPQETKLFEVFFSRDAKNHPGGGNSKNWYYYWSQVISVSNMVYGGASGGIKAAEVKAITEWSYSALKNKNEITIYDEVVDKFKPYLVGKEISGIDAFGGTLIHEAKHVEQISKADSLLPTNGSDSFRYGWSWNTGFYGILHNHWKKGLDGKWGVANTDDDSNLLVDDAAIVPPFEPGKGDDENLEHTTYDDWPKIWTLPNPLNGQHPIEAEAINATDTSYSEHQHARDDWGNPGKNHKTLNKWDD